MDLNTILNSDPQATVNADRLRPGRPVIYDPLISSVRRGNNPSRPVDAPLSTVVARICSEELAERRAKIRRVFAEAVKARILFHLGDS